MWIDIEKSIASSVRDSVRVIQAVPKIMTPLASQGQSVIRKSPRLNVFCSFLAILAAASVLGCGGDAGEQPKAKEEKPLVFDNIGGAKPKIKLDGGEITPDGIEFDFGSSEVGQEFTHDFKITNVGDGLLEIEKGDVSCTKCTSFEVDNLKVKPGETATVKVKWKIVADTPRFEQYASIRMNLPPDAEPIFSSPFKCKVKGDVVQKIMVLPSLKVS